MNRLGFALLLLAVAGCAAPPAPPPGPPLGPTCPAGLQPAISTELFFGRAIAGGGEVGDAAWQKFVDDEVTARFPNGFTVQDGTGQWLGQAGPVRERTKLLTIVHSNRPDEAAKIAAIRAAYQARFQQESVGLVEAPVCASFAAVAGAKVPSAAGR